MKNLPVITLVLACNVFTSCGKSQKIGTSKSGEPAHEATKTRNNEALESLKLIQKREQRDRELTEKIQKSAPPK